MTIKAIETRYKGYRFRSRLEARWAVFFDSAGIRWRYETEGFVVKSGDAPEFCYLPDFYLPDSDLFLEIKPDLPYDDVIRTDQGVLLDCLGPDGFTAVGKFLLASQELLGRNTVDGTHTVKPRLFMVCGTPGLPMLRPYKDRWILDSGAVILDFVLPIDGSAVLTINAFSDSDRQESPSIEAYYLEGNPASSCPRTGAQFPGGTFMRHYVGKGRAFDSPRLLSAYQAARSARFEHGESPR